jgi:hypothetical protein
LGDAATIDMHDGFHPTILERIGDTNSLEVFVDNSMQYMYVVFVACSSNQCQD